MSTHAIIKKEYKLGKGGLVSRGGEIHKPGASIWLTDDEYAAASYRERLTLVNGEGRVERATAEAATAFTTAGDAVPTEPVLTPTPTSAPITPRSVAAPEHPTPAPADISRAVESAQAKVAALSSVRNWDEFVANATAESLITYIQDSTTDEIKAIREAEKGRGKQKRVKVVSAANAALRRINMAKARSARETKMAARKAELAALPSPALTATE